MMNRFSVLLIGRGAMAAEVLRRLAPDEPAQVTAVLVRPQSAAAARASLPESIAVVTAVEDLATQPDLAVECAGRGGVTAHGAALLRRGIDLVVSSVGALADRGLYDQLHDAASTGGAKLLLIPGAVGGIDALAAARVGGLDAVRYVSRKPPLSWRGTPAEAIVDLAAVTELTELYSGPADAAARLYPQNANVAATIALAGIGFARTRVTLLADPGAGGNIHQIEASGAFGSVTVEMRGKPLADNPKTSMLAALSVVRAIRNRAGLIEI
jgi:aspartate dehydrogenase